MGQREFHRGPQSPLEGEVAEREHLGQYGKWGRAWLLVIVSVILSSADFIV